MRSLALAAVTGLFGLVISATPAAGHIVSKGVGSQSELEITPRRIRVKFNLGFAKVLGLTQLTSMDTDRDGVIRPAEQDAYVAALGQRVLPQLRLTLDGKELPLRIVDAQGLGILGRIERVGFDTWFEFEAQVAIGPGDHVVTWYDGTYAKSEEPSEQLLWVVLGPQGRYAKIEASQEQATGLPPRSRGRVRGLRGRDVKLSFAFSPAALAEDQQLALIEPWLTGIEGQLHHLRGAVQSSLEDELNGLAFSAIEFPAPRRTARFTQAEGAKMTQDRVIEESTGATVRVEPRAAGDPATSAVEGASIDAADKMIKALQQDFSLFALALFMLWGATHALMPGHGKTMVAAYLLGTEGRLSDAFKLGAIVTFTHTIALYTVGLGIVWFATESPTAFINRTAQRLTLLSGLGLIAYGAWLGWQRIQALPPRGNGGGEHDPPTPSAGEGLAPSRGSGSVHDHDHGHGHEHDHDQDHDHGHDHGHDHVHDAPPAPPVVGEGLAPSRGSGLGSTHDRAHDHAHEHDPSHGHDHAGMTAEEHAQAHAAEAASLTSLRDLWVLGVTGGLVPCPAGVVLVIFSLSFQGQNTLKAFVYLSAFSVGLASVLIAIASFMVLSRRYLLKAPEQGGRYERVLQMLPIVSCAAICVVGAFLCWQAFDPRAQQASKALLGF